MTTSRRRLPLIAICIASASLLAAQPALAGPKVVEETTKEQQAPPAQTLPDFTQMMQKIVKFLKEIQDAKTESMTSIKKG